MKFGIFGLGHISYAATTCFAAVEHAARDVAHQPLNHKQSLSCALVKDLQTWDKLLPQRQEPKGQYDGPERWDGRAAERMVAVLSEEAKL